MQIRNTAKFHKIMSGFKSAKILVIGDLMLDRFIWGTVSRISPEAPVPVVWAKSESFMPGGAANVASNIRAFGAEAHICGVVGDDETGRLLIAELAKNGINKEGIAIDTTRPTTYKTRIIAHHQQVVRIDKESRNLLENRVITQILSLAKSKISGVDAVIIEDYGKGLVVPRLIRELVKLCKAQGRLIVVDPKQGHMSFYKGVTAITPNRKEAEAASGISIKDVHSLKKAGNRLVQSLRSAAVLITLGEDGMALFQKERKWVHIPTAAQEVYDVSGAGDTVIAVFTLARVSGASMIEAAHISNVAAGVVVGKLGIGVCTTEELNSHLNQIKRYGVKSKKSSYPFESILAVEAQNSKVVVEEV